MIEALIYVFYGMTVVVFLGALVDHKDLGPGEVTFMSLAWPLTIVVVMVSGLAYCLFSLGRAFGRRFL